MASKSWKYQTIQENDSTYGVTYSDLFREFNHTELNDTTGYVTFTRNYRKGQLEEQYPGLTWSTCSQRQRDFEIDKFDGKLMLVDDELLKKCIHLPDDYFPNRNDRLIQFMIGNVDRQTYNEVINNSMGIFNCNSYDVGKDYRRNSEDSGFILLERTADILVDIVITCAGNILQRPLLITETGVLGHFESNYDEVTGETQFVLSDINLCMVGYSDNRFSICCLPPKQTITSFISKEIYVFSTYRNKVAETYYKYRNDILSLQYSEILLKNQTLTSQFYHYNGTFENGVVQNISASSGDLYINNIFICPIHDYINVPIINAPGHQLEIRDSDSEVTYNIAYRKPSTIPTFFTLDHEMIFNFASSVYTFVRGPPSCGKSSLIDYLVSLSNSEKPQYITTNTMSSDLTAKFIVFDHVASELVLDKLQTHQVYDGQHIIIENDYESLEFLCSNDYINTN